MHSKTIIEHWLFSKPFKKIPVWYNLLNFTKIKKCLGLFKDTGRFKKICIFGAMSHAPPFFPLFLTGIHTARNGLVQVLYAALKLAALQP